MVGLILPDFQELWCPRHAEPLRSGWPASGAAAMIELFARATTMPAIADAANNQADRIPDALRRFAPICCFLSGEDLAAVYAAAGVK